jgi:anti-sigma B factor antagonist
MVIRMRAVTVLEVPERVNGASEGRFLRELQKFVETERPRLVLDCSRVQEMNRAAMHLLLTSLEEAMKRNGDVKLAAVQPEAMATLEFAGARGLFEVYPTAAEAMQSFRHRPAGTAIASVETGDRPRPSESAA